MTKTVEVDRETHEKLEAEAEYLGVTPAEVIVLAHQHMSPPLGFVSELSELEGYVMICPECRAWSRDPTCWQCGVTVEHSNPASTRLQNEEIDPADSHI